MYSTTSTPITTIRAPTSLDLALAHAITFLTGPLATTLPPSRVIALQHALSASLTPHLAASWCPADPARGSGRRCLTFAPGRLPPRVVYTAAQRSHVQWERWMAALGSHEFDLFIDPGRVRVRFAGDAQARLVWSASAPVAPKPDLEEAKDLQVEMRSTLRATMARAARARVMNSLTLRTDLTAYVSSDDDELVPRPSSRASSISSSDSDSDSDSDVDSLFSATTSSSHSSATSLASSWPSPKEMPCITLTPASPIKSSTPAVAPLPSTEKILKPTPAIAVPTLHTPYQMSRREHARQRRAGVVTLPPAAPTLYDGGKTTVLGGGVRLGVPRAVLSAARA